MDDRVYRRLPAKGDCPEYLQLVVPAELQKDFMRRSHTHMCAHHLGFKKTAEQVQRRAYWVGWRRDVERFCWQCDECNRYHRRRIPKTAPLQPVVTDDVWERLSVDLTRPHPRTKRSQFDLTGPHRNRARCSAGQRNARGWVAAKNGRAKPTTLHYGPAPIVPSGRDSTLSVSDIWTASCELLR